MAGNDPFNKNLDNDIPRPFVAVKITVAHSEPPRVSLQQHVPELGGAAAIDQLSAQRWSRASESRAA